MPFSITVTVPGRWRNSAPAWWRINCAHAAFAMLACWRPWARSRARSSLPAKTSGMPMAITRCLSAPDKPCRSRTSWRPWSRRWSLRPSDRVLEVGTGTGYQAAILAELAAEVWTIERHEELASKAREILARLGYANVCMWFMVTAASVCPSRRRSTRSWLLPRRREFRRAWSRSLWMAGRLVVPVGTRYEQQVHIVRKDGQGDLRHHPRLCRFVPLVGAEGWNS